MLGFLLQAISDVSSFWDDYGDNMSLLAQYAAGILVYALIVNAFYQIISKRVMFGKRKEDGTVHVGGPGRGFLYLILFPLVSLAFFLLISASLLYLGGLPDTGAAREAAVRDIFTLSMALVAAVRVAAYISEPTSHDVAKMLPLGFLGVFLVTGRDQAPEVVESVRNIGAIFTNLDIVAIYFGAVVILEYLLRTFYLIIKSMKAPKQPRQPTRPKSAPQRPPAAQAPPTSFQRR